MKRRSQILSDSRGAGMIEFALILPVLVLFIYGIFVIGQLLEARAGIENGLGEGARLATIFPTPTDSAIKSRISSASFGTGNGTLTVADPVSGTGYKDLSVTYSTPTNFIFFAGPTVTITRTKRVYIAA